MESQDDIFLKAREFADTVQQAAYLAEACGGNAELRQRIETMLRDAEKAERFFGAEGTIAVAPASPVTEGLGTVIGRYKLLQKIGEGGMGVVYMAEQREPVVRKVALKIIKLGMDTAQVVARFEAERQALALMDHPNIAKVFDGGTTDSGRPYFVMELVQGLPMTRFCDEANLSMQERLRLFIEVCAAVQHAHQKGVIHRDLKPSNVLVTLHGDKPVPKVIDFGVAKATQGRLTDKTVFTQFQQFIGTPAYMSPEQASLSGLDVDTRSDIYALGVLLYELLTGATPFDAAELLKAGLDEMRRIIRESDPPRPSTRLSSLEGQDLTATAKHRHTEPPKLIHLVRGDLDWIVMKCLEKDRVRRYETANGLAMDLQRHLSNEPVEARPPSTLYRVQKAIRRNKGAFAAAAAIAVVLILASVISTWQAVRATRAEKKTKEQTEVAQRLQSGLDNDRGLYRDSYRVRSYENASRTNEAASLMRNLYPRLALVFPEHRDDGLELARSFVRMKLYREAQVAYEPVRKSFERDLPAMPENFQKLVEATAASKGWPTAAETCRRNFEVLPSDPRAWRSKAMTFLYVNDREWFEKAATRAMALADTCTNWDDFITIVETAARAPYTASPSQTNFFDRALHRIEREMPASGQARGRAAMGMLLFRLGRFIESLRSLTIASAQLGPGLDDACVWMVAPLCQALDSQMRTNGWGYSNYEQAERRAATTSLRDTEALADYERFLNETERWYLVLRREALSLIPGALVDSLARRQLWKEAAEQAAKSIERYDVSRYNFELPIYNAEAVKTRTARAVLLASIGNVDEYRALCNRISLEFQHTTNFPVFEPIAKSCLILPDSAAEPIALSNLLHTLSLKKPANDEWAAIGQYTLGLGYYRQANYAAATNCLGRALRFAAVPGGDYAYIEARMTLAMSQFQLGLTNEARATLSEGLKAEERQATLETRGDLGPNWSARLRDKILIKEARTLIEGAE
jgi:serine/threonine protein kinase